MDDLNGLESTEEQIGRGQKLAALGHLAHGIAHELNTPLGVIISNLSVLKNSMATRLRTMPRWPNRLPTRSSRVRPQAG